MWEDYWHWNSISNMTSGDVLCSLRLKARFPAIYPDARVELVEAVDQASQLRHSVVDPATAAQVRRLHRTPYYGLTHLRLPHAETLWFNYVPRIQNMGPERFVWQSFHTRVEEVGNADMWPRGVRQPRIPDITILHHMYSNHVMYGVLDCDTSVSIDWRPEAAELQGHPRKGRFYRDILYPQIMYTASDMCYNTNGPIGDCRCLACIPLHTAYLPDVNECNPKSFINIRCYRTRHEGVHQPWEVRIPGVPEFRVHPKDRNYPTMRAGCPRVYVTGHYGPLSRIAGVTTPCFAPVADMYAVFTDPADSRVKYVLGERCPTGECDITECACGVCE